MLARDSFLDLLARFLHLQFNEKRDDHGRKVKTEQMVFPRYHQLQAVRFLVESARAEGPGHNYLVEHSAGSGKSNTIAWLTHRLASLHDESNRRVFDSVIVVTDRVVLDQQLAQVPDGTYRVAALILGETFRGMYVDPRPLVLHAGGGAREVVVSVPDDWRPESD